VSYGWSLWRRDQELTRQLFLDGCEYRAKGSEYLGNDFLFESLRELGFWDLLTSPEPKLGRTDVAVRPDLLNAIWVVKELAGMGHLSEAEKLLSDGYLMAECGFNVETIRKRALNEDGPVVSLRTAYRHAERMPQAESERMVLNTTVMLREKKWLRGGLYAADCFEIPVSGKKMEGADENTDKKTRLGYKILTLANVREDREFIVTAAVGGICQDERVLLMRALKALRTVVEPSEIIRLLLLDRGFWKAQLLWELADEWKVPFLTIAKSDLDLTKDVRRLGGDPDCHPDPPDPQMQDLIEKVLQRVEEKGAVPWVDLYKPSTHTKSKNLRHYRARAVEDVFLDGYARNGRGAGAVNCLLAFADSTPGKPPKPIVFVTTQKVAGHENAVLKGYGERFSIENACMKWLSEHDARKMNGWTLNAVQYRLLLLVTLRNAMTAINWKYPQDAGRMRRMLAQRKRRSYIQGHGTIIYTDKGVFGTYPNDEALGMGVERGFRLGVRSVQQQPQPKARKEVRRHEQMTLPGFDEPPPPRVATLEEVSGRKRA